MADSLANFVTTGKGNFGDLVKSILADLAKMELRILESKILQSLIGYFAGVGDNGSATYANYSTATYGNTAVGVNAMGGVYSSPSLSQYSGGVYDSPRFFTFANGGVFGEAGPEAIMPLSRGSDGKLGVKAQIGGGASVTVSQSFQINNGGASGDTQTKGQQESAMRDFQKRMKATAQKTIA
jgi:lambda family phage tail tape measure protein